MTRVVRGGNGRSIEIKHGHEHLAKRRHAHSWWSLNIVLAGATDTEIATQAIELGEGAFVWVPAYVSHLCSPRGAAPFEYLVLYGSPELELDPRLTSDSVIVGRLRSPLLARLRSLARSATEGDAAHLAAEVQRALRSAATETVADATRVDPAPAARAATTSRYQHYRATRATWGISPHEHRQALRIERAKRLLRQGLSVADTAAECEFHDQSHLVKTFRLLTGLTPSQYRDCRTFLQAK